MLRISNVRLFDGEEYWQDGCVLVEGTRVRYAGDRADCPEPLGEGVTETLDGRGDLCMPGLANAHTHAAMSLMRGVGSDLNLHDWLQQIFRVEANLTPDIVRAGTMLAIMEMLRTGTTAFADMYFHVEEVLQAAHDSGIRANVSRGSVDREGILSHRTLHADWEGAGDGRLKVYVGLHAEYSSTREDAVLAAQTAAALGTGVHTHLSETRQEVEGCLLRHGMTPARHFSDLGLFSVPVIAAHCVHLRAEELPLLLNAGVSVAHCPASNLKLASGVTNLPAMTEGGIRVALGTDGPASNNTLDMFRELRLASLLQKGVREDASLMGAREALAMATEGSAKAMGFPDVGTLREGMRADLILLDGQAVNLQPGNDPLSDLVYAACGENVRLTMVNGRVLYREGEYLSLDEAYWRHAAAKAAARLMP